MEFFIISESLSRIVISLVDKIIPMPFAQMYYDETYKNIRKNDA